MNQWGQDFHTVKVLKGLQDALDNVKSAIVAMAKTESVEILRLLSGERIGLETAIAIVQKQRREGDDESA
jgi:hypothetical protein